jgi:hypothetical protein
MAGAILYRSVIPMDTEALYKLPSVKLLCVEIPFWLDDAVTSSRRMIYGRHFRMF